MILRFTASSCAAVWLLVLSPASIAAQRGVSNARAAEPAAELRIPVAAAGALPASSASAEIVRAAAWGIGAQLESGSLRSRAGGAIPVTVQRKLLGVLRGSSAEADSLAATLVASGVARRAARRLAASLTGLFSEPAPAQLRQALGALNSLVEGSSARLRRGPPAELLAIHAVLASLTAEVALAPAPF